MNGKNDLTDKELLAFLEAHPLGGGGGIITGAIAIAAAVGSTVGAGAVAGAAMIASGIGLTMSVVGAATKNKLVSQIGMGFSAAGALTGLGAATGLFDGVEAAAQEMLGQSIVESTQAQVGNAGALAAGDVTYAPGAVDAFGNTVPEAAVYTGQSGAMPYYDGGTAAATAANAPDPNAVSGSIGVNANAPAEAGTMPAQAAQITTQPGSIPTQEGASPLLSHGGLTPPTPTTTSQVPSLAQGFGKEVLGAENLADLSAKTDVARMALSSAPDNSSDLMAWWGKLDPSSKAAIMMVGGQTAAGGVGGLFTGMQAQKQLDLQRLIDQENRDQFNLMFARANTTPGLISYGATTGKAVK